MLLIIKQQNKSSKIMAITKTELTSIILTTFPNAQIKLHDFHGDEDHYSLEIKDVVFKHISLIQQHKLVKNALSDVLSSGKLHAITIKTISA